MSIDPDDLAVADKAIASADELLAAARDDLDRQREGSRGFDGDVLAMTAAQLAVAAQLQALRLTVAVGIGQLASAMTKVSRR
jgi:hypothetical protein